MTPAAIRKRIFTTTQLASITGKLGEFSVDTTKKIIVVFDGTTAGGFPLALENHTHPNATDSVTGFMTGTDHTYLYAHTHPNATQTVAGFMSAADKTNLDSLVVTGGGGGGSAESSLKTPGTVALRDANGAFAADITGNVTGNLTGNVTGNASTATDGVVTSTNYDDPSWLIHLNANKLTGTITLPIASNIPWAQITGAPVNLSQFQNDLHFITNAGNTTGSAGSVAGQTSIATPSTVIVRDNAGRARVAAPVDPADISTKAYVDALVGSGNNKIVFNTPGTSTWTVPTNVNWVKVLLIAAGGAGTPGYVFTVSPFTTRGGVGGSGGVIIYSDAPIQVTPGAVMNVVVGAGGVAPTTLAGSGTTTGDINVTNGAIDGGDGGSSSFSTLTAPGGFGAKNNSGRTIGPLGDLQSTLCGITVLGGAGSTNQGFIGIGVPGGGTGTILTPNNLITTGLPSPADSRLVTVNQAALGVPALQASILGGGQGGVAVVKTGVTVGPPGIGGGGGGTSAPTTPGHGTIFPAQNGGNGLVVIFW